MKKMNFGLRKYIKMIEIMERRTPVSAEKQTRLLT